MSYLFEEEEEILIYTKDDIEFKERTWNCKFKKEICYDLCYHFGGDDQVIKTDQKTITPMVNFEVEKLTWRIQDEIIYDLCCFFEDEEVEVVVVIKEDDR